LARPRLKFVRQVSPIKRLRSLGGHFNGAVGTMLGVVPCQCRSQGRELTTQRCTGRIAAFETALNVMSHFRATAYVAAIERNLARARALIS
jgi:hypothetical protein